MTLEPSHVLFVESPTLLLQFSSRQVLLIRSLGIVKDKEQSVGPQLFKNLGLVQNRGRRRGV